jgi:hypothetical protein
MFFWDFFIRWIIFSFIVWNNGEKNYGFYYRTSKDASDDRTDNNDNNNVYNSSCDNINSNIDCKMMVYCDYCDGIIHVTVIILRSW